MHLWSENVNIWVVLCTRISSVQFSSRWYLCAREGPYALHPVSQECSPNDALETVPMLVWFMTMALYKEDRCMSNSSFYAASLVQAIDGAKSMALIVPAGSVSSSSPLQIFQDASRLCWWDSADAEIKNRKNPGERAQGDQRFLLFKPGVMLCLLPGPRSSLLISAFAVHSTSFSSKPLRNKDCKMSGTVKRLWLVIRGIVFRSNVTQIV